LTHNIVAWASLQVEHNVIIKLDNMFQFSSFFFMSNKLELVHELFD